MGDATRSAVARAVGAGDEALSRRLTTHAIMLSLAIVGVISIGGLLAHDSLMAGLGAEPELIPLIGDYMKIWLGGVVFLVIPIVSIGVMRAIGDARTPMVILAAAAGINLVVNPLLIFGLGPFPRLELQGAALASLAARTVM